MGIQTEQKTRFCRNCGGQIEFNITQGRPKCVNCGFEPEAEQAERPVQEHDFHAVVSADSQSEWNEAVRTLRCPSCGAEITAEAHVTGVSCQYCGTALQVESGRKAGVPPEAVAPFRIEKHDALARFTKWVKKLFFAPNALKTLFQSGMLTAIYLPFWTFDASASGHYTGQGGRKRVKTVKGKDGSNQQVTEWDWYHVSGFVKQTFDDILIYAGGEKGKIAEKLRKFDLKNALVPFSSDFLAGFAAEAYTLSPQQGFSQAEKKMEREMQSQAEQDIRRSYDDARAVSVSVSYTDVKCKHILLPVWSTGFTYRGKYYNVMVNGVSGEVQGEYPKSPVKIAIAVGVAVAIIAVIVFLLSR